MGPLAPVSLALVLLGGCVDGTTPSATATADPATQTALLPKSSGIGTKQESLDERMDRLERDLANMRIDYSIVRPAMERLVSKEGGLEQRLATIEAAFGPMTASIPQQSGKQTASPAPAPAPQKTPQAQPATDSSSAQDKLTKASRQAALAPPSAATQAGGYGVHLASYKQISNVEKGWAELANRHPDLLSAYEPYIRSYNSGTGDGAYKRLIAGPLTSFSHAEKLCKELKNRGVWCQTVSLSAR